MVATNAETAILLQIDHMVVSPTPKLDNATGRTAQTAVIKLRLMISSNPRTSPRDNFTPGLERLRRAISEAGLDEAVVFTGFLEDEETRQLLAFGRALALPSLAEGFGLPAVEAAACGTPVVATRNSPLPELLDGGGLFVDPRDGEELTRALERILSDDRLQARLGARARERALQLSWKRSAEQFQELLAAVAGEAR